MKANSPGQRAKKAPIQSYASLPWKAQPRKRIQNHGLHGGPRRAAGALRAPLPGCTCPSRRRRRRSRPAQGGCARSRQPAAPGSRTRLLQAVRGARLPGRPARRADGAASVPGPTPAATLGPHRRVRVTCERGAAPAPRRGAVRLPGTSARAAGDGGARPRPHPAGGHPARGRGAPLSSPSAGPPGERVSIAPAASRRSSQPRAPGLRPPRSRKAKLRSRPRLRLLGRRPASPRVPQRRASGESGSADDSRSRDLSPRAGNKSRVRASGHDREGERGAGGERLPRPPGGSLGPAAPAVGLGAPRALTSWTCSPSRHSLPGWGAA